MSSEALNAPARLGRRLAIAFRRNHDVGACLGQPIAEMVGIVTLVGDRGARFEAVADLQPVRVRHKRSQINLQILQL